jgi:hypothetical protein
VIVLVLALVFFLVLAVLVLVLVLVLVAPLGGRLLVVEAVEHPAQGQGGQQPQQAAAWVAAGEGPDETVKGGGVHAGSSLCRPFPSARRPQVRVTGPQRTPG